MKLPARRFGPAILGRLAMACGMWEWFRPLDGIGDEAVNLVECKRFVLSTYEEDRRPGVIYFLVRSGERCRWIRFQSTDEVNEDDGGLVMVNSFAECRPQQVAHDILTRRTYGDRLPEELEEFREFGDPRRFREWMLAQGLEEEERSKTRSPTWKGKILMLGGRICGDYSKRSALKQTSILDAFNENHWRPINVRIFKDDPEGFENAFKNMKRKLKYITFFKRDHRIDWRADTQPPKT